MSEFLLQNGYTFKFSNGDKAWVTPVRGWRGMRYPNKHWVADVEIDGQRPKTRYFHNRRKAERWARRFTSNIKHL